MFRKNKLRKYACIDRPSAVTLQSDCDAVSKIRLVIGRHRRAAHTNFLDRVGGTRAGRTESKRSAN
jgi:hypothetical protein